MYRFTTITGQVITSDTVQDTHGSRCTYWYADGKYFCPSKLESYRDQECFPHEFNKYNTETKKWKCHICNRESDDASELSLSRKHLNWKGSNGWVDVYFKPTINPVYK